jgi:hypothetical protein
VIGRRLWGAVVGGTLLVLFAVVLAGCVRYRLPSEQAQWEATRDARDKAEQAREELEGALRLGEAEDPPAALELGRTGFEESVGSDGLSSLLGLASRPDGSVQFDGAIVGGAETGIITATLGRDARAAIADLRCPSSLTGPGGPLYGLIDQVVTLKG